MIERNFTCRRRLAGNMYVKYTFRTGIPTFGIHVMKEPVWCGGANGGQDVTIRLVPNGLSLNGSEEAEDREETLAVLKVHSSHLRRCSKYFETCLGERWSALSASKTNTASSDLEFTLEVHADVACYTDCFSHMYSSFRKDFRDVKYSLGLLKVASQIEYGELMDSISRYLSAIAWSDKDEMMIREYSSSPDFPRSYAEDLVSRLGLDVVEEESQKHMCGLIQHSIQSALKLYDFVSSSFRDFIESLLKSIQSEMSSSFAKTVIAIIIKEAKEKFKEFGRLCKGDESFVETLVFCRDHIRTMNWMLRVLLDAGVAEELVECFLHIEWMPKCLVSEECTNDIYANSNADDMASVVLQMCREVAAGRLLLKTAERVALIKDWHVVLGYYCVGADYVEVTKLLFSTLPLKDQIEVVKFQGSKFRGFKFQGLIDASSLATLVKKPWTAMGGKRSWPVMEGESLCPAMRLVLLLYVVKLSVEASVVTNFLLWLLLMPNFTLWAFYLAGLKTTMQNGQFKMSLWQNLAGHSKLPQGSNNGVGDEENRREVKAKRGRHS